MCNVVDGQQRTTTLVMLYAVIQEHLRFNGETSSVDKLHARFAAEKESLPFLTTKLDDFPSWFSFHKKESLQDRLGRAGRKEGVAERNTASYMFKWLEEKAAVQDPHKQLKLSEFLDFLDSKVYITLTLTKSTPLAFQTFANINYSGESTDL